MLPRLDRTVALLALLILALLALIACGPTAPATASQTQTVDGLTIALEAAATPRINDSQTFVITLTDAQGQPVDASEVYLDLTMPEMPMGTNRPIADREGPGRYSTSTAYTMSGRWEITVVASVAGTEHRALFEIQVAE